MNPGTRKDTILNGVVLFAARMIAKGCRPPRGRTERA
jgi:hypothetical protein